MNRTLQVFNFSVQNAANDAVDIHIDGDIVDASTQAMFEAWFGDSTSVSFKSFRNQINAVSAKTYNIYINSPGGMVTDAMAMHDFIVDLQNQGKTVNTIGRGIIASAATYILMASKNAEMSKNSWFMIHNVAGGIWGDVNTVERYASTLRQFNDRSRDFYAEYTNLRKEDITKLMNAETWMTADEAKEKGFIKSISGEVAFTNKIAKDQWNFSNTSVLNAYNSAVKPPQQEDSKSYIDNKIEDMKKYFTNLFNKIQGVQTPENATKEEIVNAIVNAMQAPFEEIGDKLEEEMNAKVSNALKGDEFKNAIAEAVKPFEEKIAALEQKNSDLETDIKNKIGQPTTTIVNKKDELQAVGKYVNEN